MINNKEINYLRCMDDDSLNREVSFRAYQTGLTKNIIHATVPFVLYGRSRGVEKQKAQMANSQKLTDS